ncbi:MAG: hypothetical protein SGI92_34000 [Bryobacteraceae bacterium]|nr:hypothetical protein [Bryobacteraceae bacterium]
MATWNQKNASKINGARSKGPVTPEGKAKVSQNGCKHGLYSKQTVLRNEDPAQYAEFREVYLRDYAPVSEMETDLVLDIAESRWRLRRFRVLETAALDFEMERMRPEIDATLDTIDEESRTMLAFNSLISLNRTFEVLQTSIRAQHRIIDRATSQLLRLRKIRPGNNNDDNSSNRGPRLVAPPREAEAPAPHSKSIENPTTKPSNSGSGSKAPAATATAKRIENQRTKPGTAPHANPSAGEHRLQTLRLCA